MSWREVETALNASLDDLNLGYPLIGEGDTEGRFEAQNSNDFWIEVANLPATTQPLDKALADQYGGIYQVSIYGQTNIGKAAYWDLMDQIVPSYTTGTVYTSGQTDVNIISSTPSGLIPDGSFNVINISIEWFAFVGR